MAPPNRSAAYLALVAESRTALRGRAQKLTRDPAAADDLLQETLLRGWRGFDQVREAGAGRAWLFTIMRREFLRMIERRREEATDAVEADDAGQAAAAQIDLIALRQALAGLPADYSKPLLMQAVEGKTLAQIAHALGLPENTVATRIARARKRLRDRLSGYEEVTRLR